MRDKSMGIFLIVVFGISGIAVLLLAWLGTTLESEKIAATFIGSIGLLIALIRALMLKYSPDKADNKPVPARVSVEDKS